MRSRRVTEGQISRFLTRSYAEPGRRLCAETIYRALFGGLLGSRTGKLRTGRSCRKAQRRGVTPPNKIKDMRLLDQRPAEANERRELGNWEGDRATRKSHVRSGYTDWRLNLMRV